MRGNLNFRPIVGYRVHPVIEVTCPACYSQVTSNEIIEFDGNIRCRYCK